MILLSLQALDLEEELANRAFEIEVIKDVRLRKQQSPFLRFAKTLTIIVHPQKQKTEDCRSLETMTSTMVWLEAM